MPLSHIFAPKFKASGHCSYELFLMFHFLHTFEIEEFLMFSVILHTYTTTIFRTLAVLIWYTFVLCYIFITYCADTL